MLDKPPKAIKECVDEIDIKPINFEKELKTHPKTKDCEEPECIFCGYRDCPHSEPLHYHHDGCPCCCFEGEV